MSDGGTLALISASAALCGSFLGAFGSIWIERMRQTRDDTVRLQKVRDAIRIRRKDTIEQSVLTLLFCSEPHVLLDPQERVQRMLPAIHKAQLLLDLSDPSQRALNGAINALGLAVQSGSDDVMILAAHSDLTERAKRVLNELEVTPLLGGGAH